MNSRKAAREFRIGHFGGFGTRAAGAGERHRRAIAARAFRAETAPAAAPRSGHQSQTIAKLDISMR